MKFSIHSAFLLASFGLTCPTSAQTCDVLLQALDVDGGEKMGTAVILDGNLAFSGAPEERMAGSTDLLGAVYIHEFDTSTQAWVEVAKLMPSTLFGRNKFGSSLALDGNTLVVGAPDFLNVTATSPGQVYVMSTTGSASTWSVDQILTPSDGALEDTFGASVAIAGDFILVGSPGNDEAGGFRGAAYVFEKIGGVWTETQKILPLSPIGGSQFGTHVDLEGDLALVGASTLSVPGSSGGAVVSYLRDGTNQYIQQQIIQPAGLQIADFFGASMDLTAGLLVVGTTNDDDGGSNAGAVHVFRYDTMTQLFSEEDKLIIPNASSGDFLGSSVATDGTTIVGGATGYDVAGGAFAYRDLGSGWEFYRKITPQELGANGSAGTDVAVQGDISLLGDATENSAVFNGGGTFVSNISIVDANDNGVGDVCENIGIVYCDPAVSNTSGLPGEISVFGSPFAADNQLTLVAEQLPTFVFGIFITGDMQDLILNPGGSQGHLCLGGSLGRYNQGSEIFSTGTAGVGSLVVDLTSTPTAGGPVSVLAGQTRYFQAWHRDTVGGMPASNFTDAIGVTFQ